MIGVYAKLAWRNVVRYRRRTVLTVMAVFTGTLLIVVNGGRRNGVWIHMIDSSVRRSTGHIQVQAAGYWKDRTLKHAFAVADVDTGFISSIPHVEQVSPRLAVDALVGVGDEHTTGAQVMGVIPSREQATMVFRRPVMTSGTFLADEDTSGAVIGSAMARNLKASVGDELVVFTQARDGSVAADVMTIRGIFRVGEPEMDGYVVLAHLSLVQAMLACDGRATAVALTIDDPRRLPEVKRALEGRFGRAERTDGWAVLSYEKLLPTLTQTIRFDYAVDVVVQTLLLVVIASGILNTVLMSVMERFHEFGVMMALGVRPLALGLLVVSEATLIGAIGVGAADITGYLVNVWWQLHPIRVGSLEAFDRLGIEPVLYAAPDLADQALWSGVMFGLTVLVAIWPALVAGRLRPVEAIRQA